MFEARVHPRRGACVPANTASVAHAGDQGKAQRQRAACANRSNRRPCCSPDSAQDVQTRHAHDTESSESAATPTTGPNAPTGANAPEPSATRPIQAPEQARPHAKAPIACATRPSPAASATATATATDGWHGCTCWDPDVRRQRCTTATATDHAWHGCTCWDPDGRRCTTTTATAIAAHSAEGR
jgi:hypothetical protein